MKVMKMSKEESDKVKLNLGDVRTLLTRLHLIARELNKPFDDGAVIVEYDKSYGGIDEPLCAAVTRPIYFPPEECICFE